MSRLTVLREDEGPRRESPRPGELLLLRLLAASRTSGDASRGPSREMVFCTNETRVSVAAPCGPSAAASRTSASPSRWKRRHGHHGARTRQPPRCRTRGRHAPAAGGCRAAPGCTAPGAGPEEHNAREARGELLCLASNAVSAEVVCEQRPLRVRRGGEVGERHDVPCSVSGAAREGTPKVQEPRGQREGGEDRDETEVATPRSRSRHGGRAPTPPPHPRRPASGSACAAGRLVGREDPVGAGQGVALLSTTDGGREDVTRPRRARPEREVEARLVEAGKPSRATTATRPAPSPAGRAPRDEPAARATPRSTGT